MTEDLPPGFADFFREVKENSARVVKLHPRPAWLKQCILTHGKHPEPRPILHNALVALRADPVLNGILAYNEFTCAPVILRAVGDAVMAPDDPHELTDKDVGEIQDYLQVAGIANLGKDTTHQAVDMTARNNAFHPVREYLEELEWDGVARCKTWLPVYAGTAMTDYELMIGPMFLVSMVARIFEPGCQADYMLVLEGEQGHLKSSLLRVLAEPWFSDGLPPDITNKDTQIHLRGKWLIEVAEMHQFSKAETQAFKQFVTRREEKYRPPFGRLEVTELRQCVFAGTTNHATYFKDETGSRRFWPVKCVARIQLEQLAADRDQLMAEAVQLYRTGFQHWPTREDEKALIAPQQTARNEEDPWREPIALYMLARSDTTARAVAVDALGFKDHQISTPDARRIAACLRDLGYELKHTEHGNRWGRKR